MDLARRVFDWNYDRIRNRVFKETSDDPKRAHEKFAEHLGMLHNFRFFERLILNNLSNYRNPGFEISNAAGFNKDGQFHPVTLWLLGFDRDNVGTVTGDPWPGKPRPTIARFPNTESMVNWESLPGKGAKRVADVLYSQGKHGVPITINFMSTPEKQGDELLRDLEKTITTTRNVPYVDRFELNISCPNTHGSSGKMDAREENLRMLNEMLILTDSYILPTQEIYLKVSPDSTEDDVKDTLDIAKRHRIHGITTTNTTTNHRRKYIPVSPKINGEQVGGASGNAVYEDSLRVQMLYESWIGELGLNMKIIAAGGISSPERTQERLDHGASGIQIYTPLVFKGPRLLRELRSHSYKLAA